MQLTETVTFWLNCSVLNVILCPLNNALFYEKELESKLIVATDFTHYHFIGIPKIVLLILKFSVRGVLFVTYEIAWIHEAMKLTSSNKKKCMDCYQSYGQEASKQNTECYFNVSCLVVSLHFTILEREIPFPLWKVLTPELLRRINWLSCGSSHSSIFVVFQL